MNYRVLHSAAPSLLRMDWVKQNIRRTKVLRMYFFIHSDKWSLRSLDEWFSTILSRINHIFFFDVSQNFIYEFLTFDFCDTQVVV